MGSVVCWLEPSVVRVYPGSRPVERERLRRAVARGDRASFQVCVHNPGAEACTVEVCVDAPAGIEARARVVGLVPIPHHNTGTAPEFLEGVGHIPGWAPDPLLPIAPVCVGPLETRSFWVSVVVPPEAPAGDACVSATISVGDVGVATLSLVLEIADIVVPEAMPIPVTHWFYADALCDWYDLDPFEERFWSLLPAYLHNMVIHGNEWIYVPIFTPPTDGVKRPTQLVRVQTDAPGQWSFDFSDVRRWVQIARQCGASGFEWTHLFSQWGVRHAIRVYESNLDAESLLWPAETGATSETYRGFLAQFLPAFHAFLAGEGLLGCSLFHLSDEPGPESLAHYRAARELLRELAPWMRVADALSEVEFGREGLTDIPIPSVGTAAAYASEGIPAWAYFCCGPRGPFLNRLTDTPLSTIRLTGWLLHRFQANGFLHWGYNYWYRSQTQELIDPFTELAAGQWPGWVYGDPFVVYPGADGPLDSIRWEVFGESLGDLRLLRRLGVGADDDRLAELRGYDDFPREADWADTMRRRLLGSAT